MNHSLSLVSSVRMGRFPWLAQLAQRLVLYHGELYRVPTCYRLLRIKAGMAYVTQAGQDRILLGGQGLELERTSDMALVSGIGDEPVILELFEPQI